MSDITYEPKPIDVLPLNNQLKNIMLLYPELVERLLPIKNAIEWLEGAELQLYQLTRHKRFEQSGELFKRESSGLDGDNPMQGDDPYLYLNDDISKAMNALSLKRLSRHIQTLITRDRLLAAAVPHKRLMEKSTLLAKTSGRKGGQVNASKRQPLYKEIDRLFQLEKARRPNQSMAYYAHKIEADIVFFINKNKDEFGMIGSSTGSKGERDYYDFIYRHLRQNHPKKNKK